LAGKVRLVYNEYTKMPRGQIKMKVMETTVFKRDQYANYQNLVFLFTKNTS